jgi:hypothetical protein
MGRVIGRSSSNRSKLAENPVRIPGLVATVEHTLVDVGRARLIDCLPANLFSKFNRSATIKVRVQTAGGQAGYSASKEGQRPREVLTLAVAPVERDFNLTKTPRLDEIYAPPFRTSVRLPLSVDTQAKVSRHKLPGIILESHTASEPGCSFCEAHRGEPRAKRNTKRQGRFLLIANKVGSAETDTLGESSLDRKPAPPFP